MRRPAANKASNSLADAIASFSPELPLAVAFSGGADSTALLNACVRKWPGQVGAIHVHHGLQPAADAFVRHCEEVCACWGVELSVRRVNAGHSHGQSPEAAARSARYAALQSAATDPHNVLRYRSVAIAQHADDQVETMLLALSRGAGLPGLAAMPAHWERDGVVYHRPLLGVHAAVLRAWLAQHSVTFIEDPSNRNQDITRNRIRARLLPAMQAVFPQFRDTFARSAAHAAQAQQLLDEVAREDLEGMARTSDGALVIARVQALSLPRQANLLRHWFKYTHHVVPSAAQLTELARQIAACSTRGHQIQIKVASGFAKRSGEVLNWYNAGPDRTTGQAS